jgi:hypothetical protein
VYINDGVISTYGTPPAIVADIDVPSFSTIAQINSVFDQVEFLRIHISSAADLNNIFNFNNLPGFSNLKYILFLCDYNCDPAAIGNAYILNPNSAVTVFYQISLAK